MLARHYDASGRPRRCDWRLSALATAALGCADAASDPRRLAQDQGAVAAVAAGPDGASYWIRPQQYTHGLVADGRRLDSAQGAETGGGQIAVAAAGVAWVPPGRVEVRWVPLDGSTPIARDAHVTDLDASGDLVVWTDHTGGTVTWARPSDGFRAIADRDVEYPSGVATDGERTWVIARLAARLLLYESPGAPPVQAAAWAGDNTMDLARGPHDLVFWNHATGQVLALTDGALRTVLPSAPSGQGPLAIGPDAVFGVQATFGAPGPAGVWRAPRTGGAVESLLTLGGPCDAVIAARTDGRVLVGTCEGDVLVLP